MTHKHDPPFPPSSFSQILVPHQTHKPKHTLEDFIRAIPWQPLTAAVTGQIQRYERGWRPCGGGDVISEKCLHHWSPLLAGVWPAVDEDEEVVGGSCGGCTDACAGAGAIDEIVHAYAALVFAGIATSIGGQVNSYVCEGVGEAVFSPELFTFGVTIYHPDQHCSRSGLSLIHI